jgi:hypothetical protein
MDKKSLKGYLEFFSHLPRAEIQKDAPTLLEALNSSQIHTFGWPIGIVIHNEEYKPQPFESGIRCFINTDKHKDLWTLTRNGEFYILKSLFEDIHDHGEKTGGLFFDTRTIRTAEVLMRTGMLYKALEVPLSEIMECSLEYGGLSGRVLTAANPNRAVTMSPPPKICTGQHIKKTFQGPISDFLDQKMLQDMVFEVIKSITEMCDFFIPSKSQIIDPMVESYINGKII